MTFSWETGLHRLPIVRELPISSLWSQSRPQCHSILLPLGSSAAKGPFRAGRRRSAWFGLDGHLLAAGILPLGACRAWHRRLHQLRHDHLPSDSPDRAIAPDLGLTAVWAMSPWKTTCSWPHTFRWPMGPTSTASNGRYPVRDSRASGSG